MNPKKEYLSRRRRSRSRQFGISKQIPVRKVFRRTKREFVFLIFSVILIGISAYRLKTSDDPVGVAMGMVVVAVAIFGYAIKLILSLLFPIIILNRKGIKFTGTRQIMWSEIQSIIVKYNADQDQIILIRRLNLKMLLKNIEPDEFKELGFYVRSFRRRFKKEQGSATALKK